MNASSHARLSPHLHAVAALLVCGFFVCMGLPRAEQIQSKRTQAQLAKLGPAATAAVGAYVAVTQPVTRRLNRVEQLFRIRQLWTLYGEGPARVQRMEVGVDGAVVFRSADRAHRWRAAQLRHRRVRPMIDTLASKAEAFNWKGMGRFIVSAAREDFPDADRVEIVITRAGYGDPDSTPAYGRAAQAPGWALGRIPAAQLPDSTP